MSSSTAHLERVEAASQPSQVETWFRRALWTVSAIAAIGILCHLGLLLWAHNEFSAPESIVSTQSLLLAQHGTLYYSLKTYPYTVCAYMPQFYLLEAALSKLGLTTALAGRLVSFAAMLGILALVWKLVLLYTGDRYCAWTALALCASTSLILSWGTIGQVDMLAIFWSMAAFYQYSRYSLRGQPVLLWAGLCALLAFFTKQTAIACPVTIFAMLWFARRGIAIKFAAGLAGAAGALALAINAALHGRFLLNTVVAAITEMSLAKLGPHVHYMLVAAAQLLLIALVGLTRAWRAKHFAPYLYLAIALAVLALTAPKLGSDSNYQIESTVLLVVCASIALHEVGFFPLCFRRSQSWLVFLQIPLAIHFVENFRITENVLATRVATEVMMRAQVEALRPYAAGGGRLLSTDFNAMARLRGYMEVEPFIYAQLVKSRVIDPEPVRRDIAAQAFPTIFLYEDLDHRESQPDPEVTTFTEAQRQAIARSYRLVAHVPGPYQNGIYVYQPRNAN